MFNLPYTLAEIVTGSDGVNIYGPYLARRRPTNKQEDTLSKAHTLSCGNTQTNQPKFLTIR
jgi:hypothetical protein